MVKCFSPYSEGGIGEFISKHEEALIPYKKNVIPKTYFHEAEIFFFFFSF